MEKEFLVLLADGRQFSVQAGEFRHSSYNGSGVTFMLGNEVACFVPTASVGAIVERSALVGEVVPSRDVAVPTFTATKRQPVRAAHATNGKTSKNGSTRRARR